MAGRLIRLRYAGRCTGCAVELPAGAQAWWDRETKLATCSACWAAVAQPASPDVTVEPESPPAPTTPEPGIGGASAQREHDRRSAKREARIRAAHPRIGGLLLALSDDPRSTKVWAKGAEGERKVARMLNKLVDEGMVVLHDRGIPRTKVNIDHLVVAPSGIHVIDTKRYSGKVERRSTGGLLRARVDQLVVAGRDKTPLVYGVGRQIIAVRQALGDLVDESDPPVRGALCFVDSDWGLLASEFSIQGIAVMWPRATVKWLRRPGPLTSDRIAELAERLVAALPPA